MLVNTTWLLDYLQPHCTHDELLDTFTAAGLEVEESHRLSQELQSVVVGFIREKTPLPENDGLFACRIEVGKNRLIDVVCASEHAVEVGSGVPVAIAGTTLPSGVEIRAANYHGVHSEGMICLDGEMGLIARTSGLQMFQDEAALGRPLPDVINIPELLVDLAVLPNRPDCLGLIGIAREIAAVLGLKLNYPVSREAPLPTAATSVVPVRVENAELCCRYLCQAMRGVKVGSSPHWLKSRLLTAGKRPINNVVDVTNFVLLEWGQPLHAFDLATIKGGEIHVRAMKAGESLELLDGTVVKNDSESLVIADGERPIALAGIMGGSDTQTAEATTDVLIEAACFDPVNIRSTSKRLGIASDSSYRFERGTDPNWMLTGAATRACSLIGELAGGTLDGVCTEHFPTPRKSRSIRLTAERVSNYLGMDVIESVIRNALTSLEMTCDDDLAVEVPTWRVDVNDPVVLIEDVARLVGYDSIPLKPMTAVTTAGQTTPMDRLRGEVAAVLCGHGFLECRKAPLRDVVAGEPLADPQATPIVLRNPMRSDMTALRTSLLPGLLDVVESNSRRGSESFRVYEIDRVFHNGAEKPTETWTVSFAAGGEAESVNWSRREESVTFFQMKGVIENVLDGMGIFDAEFRASPQRSGFLPSESAEILVDGNVVGVMGRIDPPLLTSRKIRTGLFVCELNLESLVAGFSRIRTFRGLPRTQSVTRDLALVVPRGISFANLKKTVESVFAQTADNVHRSFQKRADANAAAESHPPVLEQISCIDFYQGKQVKAGCKSVAIRLIFRERMRTLTSEESAQLTDAVIDALKKEHDAELRQ